MNGIADGDSGGLRTVVDVGCGDEDAGGDGDAGGDEDTGVLATAGGDGIGACVNGISTGFLTGTAIAGSDFTGHTNRTSADRTAGVDPGR